MDLPNAERYRSQAAPRVLLVEDHESLAEATVEFLRREGLEVQRATTGGTALTLAVAFRPDIILCDLNLPDMKGDDLARALWKRSATRNALFVIHTADSRHVNVPGVDLFISKPITREKAKRIFELWKRRREEDDAGRE